MTDKVRVHELAREIGVSCKEVLAALKAQGEFVKSASSTVEAPVARRLRESFGVPRTDSVQAKQGPSAFPTRTPWPGKARVHELAREIGVSSKEVLAALKAQGEFVKSASSTVEAPVARRLRESFALRPAPTSQSIRSDTLPGPNPPLRLPPPRTIPGPPRPVPRPIPKPRPRAPAPLPSTQLITASEAYAFVGVRPETVRKWASRGYLKSKGKRGRAALYDREDLMRARNETRSRTINPAVSSELYVPPSYSNRLITTNEVARLFGVAPSTVRSWVRRGHLTPARRGTHGWLFKIGLVLIAADNRRGRSIRSRQFDYPD